MWFIVPNRGICKLSILRIYLYFPQYLNIIIGITVYAIRMYIRYSNYMCWKSYVCHKIIVSWFIEINSKNAILMWNEFRSKLSKEKYLFDLYCACVTWHFIISMSHVINSFMQLKFFKFLNCYFPECFLKTFVKQRL